MHYAHRSIYIAHRASCITYKSICKSRAMCISQIVAIGVSLACGDRLQSKSHANNFMRKLLTAAPYRANAIAAISYAQPAQNWCHGNPYARDCELWHWSKSQAPQKWENMVMRTRTLEAKFGGDFKLRPSNCWGNLEATWKKERPRDFSRGSFRQPFSFSHSSSSSSVGNSMRRPSSIQKTAALCVIWIFMFYPPFEDIIPRPFQYVKPYFQKKYPASPGVYQESGIYHSFGSEWPVLAFWRYPYIRVYPQTIKSAWRAL